MHVDGEGVEILFYPFPIHLDPEFSESPPPTHLIPSSENNVVKFCVRRKWRILFDEKIFHLDDMAILAQSVNQVKKACLIAEPEIGRPIERVYRFLDEMGGGVALEEDAESGVVGKSRFIGPHLGDEIPGLIELEEFTEDIDEKIVGLEVVPEALLLDPEEEIEGTGAVIGVAGDRIEH